MNDTTPEPNRVEKLQQYMAKAIGDGQKTAGEIAAYVRKQAGDGVEFTQDQWNRARDSDVVKTALAGLSDTKDTVQTALGKAGEIFRQHVGGEGTDGVSTDGKDEGNAITKNKFGLMGMAGMMMLGMMMGGGPLMMIGMLLLGGLIGAMADGKDGALGGIVGGIFDHKNPDTTPNTTIEPNVSPPAPERSADGPDRGAAPEPAAEPEAAAAPKPQFASAVTLPNDDRPKELMFFVAPNGLARADANDKQPNDIRVTGTATRAGFVIRTVGTVDENGDVPAPAKLRPHLFEKIPGTSNIQIEGNSYLEGARELANQALTNAQEANEAIAAQRQEQAIRDRSAALTLNPVTRDVQQDGNNVSFTHTFAGKDGNPQEMRVNGTLVKTQSEIQNGRRRATPARYKLVINAITDMDGESHGGTGAEIPNVPVKDGRFDPEQLKHELAISRTGRGSSRRERTIINEANPALVALHSVLNEHSDPLNTTMPIPDMEGVLAYGRKGNNDTFVATAIQTTVNGEMTRIALGDSMTLKTTDDQISQENQDFLAVASNVTGGLTKAKEETSEQGAIVSPRELDKVRLAAALPARPQGNTASR